MFIRTVVQTAQLFKKPSGIPDVQASPTVIQTVLQFVFGLAGAVALLIITIAGTMYILSQGDPQKVAKAKNTIIYALIGLVITILSYSIVSFVVTKVV
jgi:hypothetical protein